MKTGGRGRRRCGGQPRHPRAGQARRPRAARCQPAGRHPQHAEHLAGNHRWVGVGSGGTAAGPERTCHAPAATPDRSRAIRVTCGCWAASVRFASGGRGWTPHSTCPHHLRLPRVNSRRPDSTRGPALAGPLSHRSPSFVVATLPAARGIRSSPAFPTSVTRMAVERVRWLAFRSTEYLAATTASRTMASTGPGSQRRMAARPSRRPCWY